MNGLMGYELGDGMSCIPFCWVCANWVNLCVNTNQMLEKTIIAQREMTWNDMIQFVLVVLA
jgi:hypothetical protein